MTAELPPRCYDCLSEDVVVKVIDQCGLPRWFCAEDWAGWVAFGERLQEMLQDAYERLP